MNVMSSTYGLKAYLVGVCCLYGLESVSYMYWIDDIYVLV